MKKTILLLSLTAILIACSEQIKPAKVYDDSQNIFVAYTDGTKKQLTFNRNDHDPIYVSSLNEVVFIRSQNSSGYLTHKIMRVNIDNLSETIISDQMPYESGIDGTHELVRVDNPTLSADGNHLLFITDKYATASSLQKLNLKTGAWTELFSAESYEVLTKEPYVGYFLVAQSDIEDRGRDIYYRLLNDSGRIIKRFSDEESLNAFRASLKESN